MSQETLQEKIARVTAESVEVVEYDPSWPLLFEQEKQHLYTDLPDDLIIRIEHFGSTAVPGLAAKPIVDMLVEITDVDHGKIVIPEILEPQGYDCFWRPLGNINEPPYYTWCIKRDGAGQRTHHLHFVSEHFKDHDLRFRDILRDNKKVTAEYAALKFELSLKHERNRIDYTIAKGEFIKRILREH